MDLDETKLEMARAEARDQGVAHVEFRKADAGASLGAGEYDLVYARFLRATSRIP